MLWIKEQSLNFVFEPKFLLQKHFKCCKQLLRRQYLIGIKSSKMVENSSVEDDPRSGRQSTSINDQEIYKVREFILSDSHLKIRDIEEVPTSSTHGFCTVIMHHLKMQLSFVNF